MPESNTRPGIKLKLWCCLLGIILTLVGLFFAIAGGKLVSLGGSSYFLVAGIVTLLAAVQFFRRKSSAVVLFLLVFIGTLIWSVYDAGFDFWPLVSRLMVPTGLMLLALLGWPTLRKSEGKAPLAKLSYLLSAVLAVGMVGTFVQMFQPHPTVAFSGKPLPLIPVDKAKQQKDWDNYGNTPGGSRFVALDQITRDNVKDLKVAWTFHTGDTPISPGGNGAEDQQTPLQIGNRIFLCTPHNNVIAVEADSSRSAFALGICETSDRLISIPSIWKCGTMNSLIRKKPGLSSISSTVTFASRSGCDACSSSPGSFISVTSPLIQLFSSSSSRRRSLVVPMFSRWMSFR